MSVRKLLATAHRATPWKNGGGTTIEVAAYPEGAGIDAFVWRVSIARVDAPGPFSRFDGVDRSIAVVTGRGMSLAIDGRGAVRLEEGDPPFAFPGEVAVAATLGAGSTEDFNVMTRRGRAAQRVTRVRVEGERTFARAGAWLVLVVVRGYAVVTVDGRAEPLTPRDALLIDDDRPFTLRSGDASLFVVDLWSLGDGR